MKSLSLKLIYENLLQEAIIDQSTFLDKLVKIVDNKMQEEGNLGILLNKIVKMTKDLDLPELKDAQDELQRQSELIRSDLTPDKAAAQSKSLKQLKQSNKKARKKVELLIHKALQEIKGLNGAPINLKKMRPLYDSIIQYISSKKDIDIEHCLLAADYYMKDFYDNANEKEKSSVDNGNIDFKEILRITKFYQQYFEFKDKLGLFEDSTYKIYEDDLIKVVYPQTSYAFNSFINASGIDVHWCTQSPSTWNGYNQKQFVMIIQDKVGGEGIISLKVNFDGSVDYEGTCNQYNEHMDRYSVRAILPVKAEDAIGDAIAQGLVNNAAIQDYDAAKITEYINGLLDENNYQEIYSLLIAVSGSDTSGDTFFETIETLLEYSKSKNKLDQAINIFVDAACSLNFDSDDFNIRSCQVPIRNSKVQDDFRNLIVQKCLDKRSHVKYFIAFCRLYNSKFEKNSLVKQMAYIALDKKNPVNFIKTIDAISANQPFANMLIEKDYFPEAFFTKGFKVYFNEKKDKIRVLDSEDYSFHPMGDRSEMFVSNIIAGNKESFVEFVQKYNEEENENVDINSLDYSLICRFILHQSNFQKYDIADIGLEKIAEHTFDLQESDLQEIVNNIYTDFSLVKFLCEQNDSLVDALLSHYFSLEVSYITDNKRNSSIDLNNQETYRIFLYLLKNSTERIPVLIDGNQPALTVANGFNYTVRLINKFGGTPQNLDSEIKEMLLKIASRNLFYGGLLRKNYPLDDNLVDFFFEIISNVTFKKESLGAIKSCILSLDLLNHDQADMPLQKLLSKIVAMPQVRNFITLEAQDSGTTPAANIDSIYVMFYLLNNINARTETITSVCVKYLNIISEFSIDRYTFDKLQKSGKQINAKIVSSMSLSKETTQSIGRLIEKQTFWKNFYFKDFIFLLVKRCNQDNIGFYKEHLAKIFYNDRFKNLSNNDRQEILTNFISKGSDQEENYLDTRDRAIVRDCLKDCLAKGTSLQKDYDFIMDLCENLDRYSRFQLRTVFPKEERLKDKDSNEALIMSYIKLFLD